ncbi:MAG TPA: hypothetical protein VL633_11055 [Bacteroidota bacterium]|nr:hypothetical protein [Bacteroidota bacterium]
MKLTCRTTSVRYCVRGAVLTMMCILSFGSSHAQLSGTKTIGGGGDYGSFNAAAAALMSEGVSGAVTFNVMNGTYNEQVLIGSIPGASETNTITFQSQSGNRADVTLAFAPPADTNNYVVHLFGARYVTFQNMTLDASGGTQYGNVVKFDGDADYDRIINNAIVGVSTSLNSETLVPVYASDDSSDYTIISGNTVTNGSIGVAMFRTNPDAFSAGIQVSDNVFTNQSTKGISLSYHNGAIIRGNSISTSVTTVFVGIDVTRCDSTLEILANKITIPDGGFGINMYTCNGSAGYPGLVANNFVTSLHGNSTGVWASNCTYQNIYYNSVNITNESFEGQALLVDGTAANVNIVNNIFANSGTGYSVSIYSPASTEIASSDYNNLYTNGLRVASWEGLDVADLAALQLASGRDAHSIAVEPLFASTTNLHLYSAQNDSQGTPLAAVTRDIDGDFRDPQRPDIGADEFALVRVSLNQGWNMVSVPLVVPDFHTSTLFPATPTSVFAYLAGSYSAQSILANRLGYWVKYNGPAVVTMTGDPISPDTIQCTLGWNLIGSITWPVPASHITTIPGGLIASPFYEYNISYQAADTIRPGKAYWVKLLAPGTLILSASADNQPAHRPQAVREIGLPPLPPESKMK